jgi:hypothetical protein
MRILSIDFIFLHSLNGKCGDSDVMISIMHGRPGFVSRRRQEIFSPLQRPDQLWAPAQPPIQSVPGALFSEVKRPGREADCLVPWSRMVELYLRPPITCH